MRNSYSEEEIKDKLSFIRLSELKENPIQGNFDVHHLKKINAYIFQDSPDVAGKFRHEVAQGEHWHKERNYKGWGKTLVSYSRMTKDDIQELDKTLQNIDIDKLKNLSKTDFAKEIHSLYKQLDYLHPFPDGNSRTLREFTRTLSEECGYKLDWSKHSQSEVYLGRDFDVNRIAISKSRDPQLIDRLQEENNAILAHNQYKPLENIISTSLSEKSLNKSYKIEFVYNKEDKTRYSYNVLVNNVQASEAMKQNPEIAKVLDHVASHKDLVAKGVTAEQLKSGVIYPQKLDNEIKVTRPENRIVDNQGNKIELTKAKASQLEL
ncbi:TPA: Fic family protein [Pasteurella multocida]|nr:Fic family protein [Pasteurella multocida]